MRIAQLADVARPGVGGQPRGRFGGDVLELLLELSRELANEMASQEQDVTVAIAQRRQMNAHDLDRK